MLTQPQSTAVVYGNAEWPTSLKTAAEMALILGVDEQRLIDLADAQVAPHWRIDGGQPLFKSSELKSWAANHLLTHCAGSELPTRIAIVYEPAEANPHSVPKALRDVAGLRDATQLLQLCSGIYFLCHLHAVVYVGQSINPGSRISTHTVHKEFDRVFFLPWPRFDLDRIEQAFIKILKPPLNGTSKSTEPSPQDYELIGSVRLTTGEC